MKKLLFALLCALAGTALADGPVGIGLFAPTAPFSGPVARLEFISALATQLGPRFTGRAYARAADFAAAVKRGELAFAVVDAAYLAATGGNYRVLAVAERGGATEVPWEVVTSTSATSLLALRGRTVVVPDIGARDEDFLAQVLLEGELPRDFFAKATFAPDALSALAGVERGRAECAIVPSGLPLPAGVHRVATLRALSWPVLVALPGASDADAVATAATATRFAGQALDRLSPGGQGAVAGLAGRFGRSAHRPPFLVPPLRVSGGSLVGGADHSIERVDATSYLIEP